MPQSTRVLHSENDLDYPGVYHILNQLKVIVYKVWPQASVYAMYLYLIR